MITIRSITPLLLVVVILLVSSCREETSATTDTLYLKDFKFESYFGHRAGDATNTYCLLGQGFFRTPQSKNSDSLLSAWLIKHPEAIVIKITSFATDQESNPEPQLVYCWIIDGNDTLNNYLIRQGCYPGGTMQRPKTWEEMSDEERKFYGEEEKPKVTVHIDKRSYDTFINQIKVAEIYARENELGIWSEADNEIECEE
jgi:hypothetical protein